LGGTCRAIAHRRHGAPIDPIRIHLIAASRSQRFRGAFMSDPYRLAMDPTSDTHSDATDVPVSGYHAYVGIIRTLGCGDDGFCPSSPALLRHGLLPKE
jgi:hypothetical protein